MYSRIPVPQIEWKEENRRYALCYFPVVGVIIGIILLFWHKASQWLELNSFMFAAIAAAIPVFVTGGIHLDGFCDVSDANASYADREKRLEIMKDPHIGSFAVIRLVIYFIIQTALFAEVSSVKQIWIIAFGYVISRSLSGLGAVTLTCAKKSGSLYDFAEPAHKERTKITLLVWLIVGALITAVIQPLAGIAVTGYSLLMYQYYKVWSYHFYGGITGDLNGWFLQKCELAILAAAVFAVKIMEAFR